MIRLIDANALLKSLKSGCENCSDANTNWCEHCCKINDFEDLIDNAPTVEPNKDNGATQYSQGYYDGFMSAKELITKEPERPKGEWITEDSLHCLYYCSNCRNNGERIMPYCPWCGADMRGDNND